MRLALVFSLVICFALSGVSFANMDSFQFSVLSDKEGGYHGVKISVDTFDPTKDGVGASYGVGYVGIPAKKGGALKGIYLFKDLSVIRGSYVFTVPFGITWTTGGSYKNANHSIGVGYGTFMGLQIGPYGKPYHLMPFLKWSTIPKQMIILSVGYQGHFVWIPYHQGKNFLTVSKNREVSLDNDIWKALTFKISLRFF
jgi:hypothetical protein